MVHLPSTSQPLWHSLPASKVLAQLASNIDSGLSSNEIDKRYSEFGYNEIVGKKANQNG
ncbi:cation-transporting P-type ATPase [Gloeocapsa sp. BRSZ]